MADCRMYENPFPEQDDVVMVQVKSIAEMGAYVSLLEYNGIEGMILLSELSRRRIRSITKLIKVGRQEPVMVLRVDKDKGYIDLSKRRVSPEDAAQCEAKFNKGKLVHSIMRHVAETTGTDVTQLYEQFGWPLAKLYGHVYEGFKVMAQDPTSVMARLTEANGGQPIELLTDDVMDAVMKDIKRRMTPQPVKIRADVELTCFNYDGLLHIQAAMRAGEAKSTEECPVKMVLVAPPLYVLTTSTLHREKGLEVLGEACEAVRGAIEAAKGRMVLKEAPRAVSEREDKMLNQQLQELAAANAEVDGDASLSEEEDMGMGNVDIDAAPALAVA